jgi:hypothetical protein
LAYLGMTNALAMLRLLPMSDRAEDAEILTLRHQITILQCQLGSQKVRFEPTDRTLLAALLHGLPRDLLRQPGCWYSPTPKDGTSARAQVVRRQPDGSWLRLLDQPEFAPPTR